MSFGMRWACIGLVLAAAGLGCTKKNPILICHDGQCSDPQYKFCDVDGAIGGEPNTCLKPQCTASAFVTCDGSNAITCNAEGSDYERSTCQFGCSAANSGCNQCAANTSTCATGAVETCDANGVIHSETCAKSCVDGPTPHCEYLSPKYLPDICETPGDGTLTWGQSGDFDSDLDLNCTGGVVQQAGAPPICVVRYASIKIVGGATLHVFSSVNRQNFQNAGRAIALVSDGDLSVDGAIDVSASRLYSGPGGGYVFSGGGDAHPGDGNGGAGFATAGAGGGSAGSDGGADDGGAALMDPADLETLSGGPQSTGGGGGALVLVSCHGSVSVSGWLNAGGGGGVGGYYILDGTRGGGGGGAGGNIVLEGLDVHVTGGVFANGGGGGAGGIGSAGSSTNEDGRDGSIDLSGPPGGVARAGAGNGGAGGSVNGLPQPGLHPTGSGGAGGGGGSMGFAQTYTPAGVTPTLTPAAASPAFRPNATVPTR